jgi:hypothetical protein
MSIIVHMAGSGTAPLTATEGRADRVNFCFYQITVDKFYHSGSGFLPTTRPQRAPLDTA